MSEFERVGERVAHALGGVSDDCYESVRNSFLDRAGGVEVLTPRRKRWLLVGTCLAVAAGSGAIWREELLTLASSEVSPENAEDLWLEGPKHGAPTRVELGDGAHVDLVAGTRSRVHRGGDGRTRVTLEGGVIEVRVGAEGSQRWSFYAGPYLAKTSGGEFFINYQPASSRIQTGVTSGRLRISGGPLGADSVVLEPGQRLSAGAGSIVVGSLTEPSNDDLDGSTANEGPQGP
jgi:ferric-dicitrate binding protein FerR (iron transport regulator)